jgi:hypothetical protein
VHGIGNHCRAVAKDASNELECDECRIAHTAHECHLIYLFFSRHVLNGKGCFESLSDAKVVFFP